MVSPKTSANLTQHNILEHIFTISDAVESSADKRVLQGVKQISLTLRVSFLPAIAEGDPAAPDLLDLTQCQNTGQK